MSRPAIGHNDRRALRVERLVALATAVVAAVVYVITMPPAVTLETGDFATAGFQLGVPRTPGYPLWSLSGYVWTHFVFPFGNPSWRLAMMSVAAAAGTVAALALTMQRSTRMLLRSLPWSASIPSAQTSVIELAVSVCTALAFGFDRAMWQWAGVPAPQALYALLYFLAVSNFLNWVHDPERGRALYATVFFLALSMAAADENAPQIFLVMALPFIMVVVAKGLQAFNATRKH